MRPFPFGPTIQPWALGRGVLFLGLLVVLGACERPQTSVQSHLEGHVVVDSADATTDDHSGFRVLVLRPDGRRIDTLGHARTDRDGRFRMTISAPRTGIYPLTLWDRTGRRRLAGTDYVVAPGDSGTLTVELPLRERAPRPESSENRALRAYRNAMTMHQRMLTRSREAEASTVNTRVQNIRLTSSTLWTLRDRYPDTYAAQFAVVQSLSFLEGWNDSLVVARARQVSPASPRYVDAARIARRAEARRHGHRSALALVDSFQVRAATPRQKAGVKAIRIQAFLDSMQVEAALSSAQRLKADHSRTQWARWARRVRYEARHLQPGMTAPNLTLQTLAGDSLSLRGLRGRPVVLEYYRTGSDLYNLQRPLRNALYETTRSDSVAFLSISVEPDSLVNRAFLRNQRLPGHKAIAPKGREDPLATQYNVVQTPAWVLIGSDGAIVDQYGATELPTLGRHLTRLLPDSTATPAPTSAPDSRFVPGGSFAESGREGLETSHSVRVRGSYQSLHQRPRRSRRSPLN